MDKALGKAVAVDFLRSDLLGFVQLVEILLWQRQRHRSRGRVIVVLEAVGYTGKEKRGQDGGVLRVEQADNLPVRVGRPRNDDIALHGGLDGGCGND